MNSHMTQTYTTLNIYKTSMAVLAVKGKHIAYTAPTDRCALETSVNITIVALITTQSWKAHL